jgi:hypothetical protein
VQPNCLVATAYRLRPLTGERLTLISCLDSEQSAEQRHLTISGNGCRTL